MLHPSLKAIRDTLAHIASVKRKMNSRMRPPSWIDNPPRTFCLEDFILTFGRRCTFDKVWSGGVTERACFQRAYEIAVKNPDEWIYVEGFACPAEPPRLREYPLHHAWLVHISAPTKAVEVAWEQGGAAYLGVALKPAYLQECHRRGDKRWYGAIETWWMDEHLLNGMVSIQTVENWPRSLMLEEIPVKEKKPKTPKPKKKRNSFVY